MQVNSQQSIEGPLDKSFEEIVTKILATDEDNSADMLTTQLSLTQELLDNLSMGNCFQNGVPPWKQTSVPDVSGMSSAQLIQEALAFMRQTQELPQAQGHVDFSNAALSTPKAEEESQSFSGMGSPRSSVAGSYSSGDEVGWPNMPFHREEYEVATSSSMSRNSPQLGNQYTESNLDSCQILHMRPAQQGFNNGPKPDNRMDARGDVASNFTPRRASPIVMADGMFPHNKMADFRNVDNNAGGTAGYSSPRATGNSHSMNNYPTNVSRQQTDDFAFVPRPTFTSQESWQTRPRYPGGQQWKTQQGYYPRFSNQKVDAQIAGFPRNVSCKSHVPMWMKHQASFQQRGNCAGPMTPLPQFPMGEMSSAVRECQEQLQNLEKERRKTETELVRMNPGKRISSSNTIAVPPLPPNPSSLDQLITEEFREHSRMTALLSKVGGLNARVLHPNIEICLDRWMSAIQAIEAYRTAEMCQAQGKGRQMIGGPVTEKLQELIKATSGARTKLWCALQLSKEKHMPPLQKEILSFVPEGVHVV